MPNKPDPVTQEILRSSLNAAAEEMKLNLIRTSHSTLIYEILDFAVGLFDADGRTLAQASGLPIFLGNLGASITDAVKTYGLDGIEPGDLIITNDPYTTGTHLGDMSVCSPIFFEGKLVAFAAGRGHLLDLGGKAPGGGWFFDTTDVHQEGIRFKSLKLFKAGEVNQDIISIFRTNTRFTDVVLGDLFALVAACRTGEKRFSQILSKLGVEETFSYVERLMDHDERIARAEIEKIPDGEYEASAFLDNDGVDLDQNVPIKIKVRVSGDEMTFDFSEMPPMVKGPINCGAPCAVSVARVAAVSLTTPFLLVNEGNFRPIKTIIPPGTLVSAIEPAPVAAYAMPLVVLVDLTYKALSEAIPDRVPAGHYGAISSIIAYGRDERTGRNFIHIEGIQGGWGGRSFEDGESVVTSLMNGDTRNVPVEVLEARSPLVMESFGFRQDSAGPGKFRGGLGYERVHRVLDQEAQVNIFFERNQCPPWGLFGGKPGQTNKCSVATEEGAPEEVLLKTVGLKLKPGARIRMMTGGGGGHGDPLERDPTLVERDVVRGYVSPEAALKDYGAVFDATTGKLDPKRTEEERKKRRPTP